jgi:hypothetical protein
MDPSGFYTFNIGWELSQTIFIHGYDTLRFVSIASGFNLPITKRFAFGIGVSQRNKLVFAAVLGYIV